MKFLTVSAFVTILSLQSAFAEIPDEQKEFVCVVESQNSVLNNLVLDRNRDDNNTTGDIDIQYAYTRQEAIDNFLRALAPQHYIVGGVITIIDRGSKIKDVITDLDCQETK